MPRANLSLLLVICNTLQPAGEKCCNPACGSNKKFFAKYSCQICHLYDDSDKSIYHCPFCNVCRKGKGLGIDFKHCMRCNACVSMDEEHVCIPQSLQGNCPICHETMFQSTQPLRRLKCGHVMHLSCFTTYAASGNYTCPLCKKSVDDMSEYFALLDAAVRMQPMPLQYLNQSSNIYCQVSIFPVCQIGTRYCATHPENHPNVKRTVERWGTSRITSLVSSASTVAPTTRENCSVSIL